MPAEIFIRILKSLTYNYMIATGKAVCIDKENYIV